MAALEPTEWRVPHHYHVGDHASWRSVRLVCTRDHYAGDQAEHPWDPGAGWQVEKAATLWAPNGRVETQRLYRLLTTCDGDRLRDVVTEAVGV